MSIALAFKFARERVSLHVQRLSLGNRAQREVVVDLARDITLV